MGHQADIGIIGGSGLYEIPGLEEMEEIWVDTPFVTVSYTHLRAHET